MTSGTDLTILVALAAGLISFLSPCVLPLVPAYLGQLSAIAVAGGGIVRAGRWLAVRHAIAFVFGFTGVFALLGVTATYLAQGLVDILPALRVIGGVILIVLGLSLAGILHIPALDRTWRPLDTGAAGSLATTTGSIALSTGGPNAAPGFGDRLGGALVGSNGGLLASLGLGAIFAIGWTPCIGIILGGILTMAATSGTVAQGTLLLIAYCIGLGVPFLLIALAYDRAPALIRPLLRHGRTVSLIGGLLVSAIGVAMVLDLLRLLPRYFQFLTAI
jgi:cytochrome c-type biogenesis protein